MSQWRIAMVDSEPSAIEADRVIVSAGDGWLLFQKQGIGGTWETVAALPRDRVHAVIRAEDTHVEFMGLNVDLGPEKVKRKAAGVSA